MYVPIKAASPDSHNIKVIDEIDAQLYCDETPLLKIEGIWEFPSDGTRVLIRRTSPASKGCDIIVISSPDCRLFPGDDIGDIVPSGETGKYNLSICRSRVKGLLSDPGHCSAKLSSNFNALSFTPRKYKVSLGNLWFLPRFWRSIRIRKTNDNTDSQNGLIRIYPSSPSSRDSEPIYL